MRSLQEINEKIKQHQDNLELWIDGTLTPTEPDHVEREAVMRELKAAIQSLLWVTEPEWSETKIWDWI